MTRTASSRMWALSSTTRIRWMVFLTGLSGERQNLIGKHHCSIKPDRARTSQTTQPNYPPTFWRTAMPFARAYPIPLCNAGACPCWKWVARKRSKSVKYLQKAPS
jgi:hypothetical protein